MRDLSRLTIEEKNRYLILEISLETMLCMRLDDIIDFNCDQEILEEIKYFEGLADGRIFREEGKVKSVKPSKKSQKNK